MSASIHYATGRRKTSIAKIWLKKGSGKIYVNGKNYETLHFKLKSTDESLPDDKKLNFDIWLEPREGIIIKVAYERMGKWEYRLKNIE